MKKSDIANRWLVLIAMTSCLAMIFLDSTILPVALPTIQKSFGISPLALRWIVDIYFLCNASFVIAGGRVADLFGHRFLFCTGMLLFAFASAIGGISQNLYHLLAARALQGIGAAFMGPASMAVLIDVFPLKERGKVLGVSVSISSIFLALGPFIGGLLTEMISWRWIFLVNFPIALLGITLALISVKKSVKRKEPFDAIGCFLLIFGLVCSTIFLMEIRYASLIVLLQLFFTSLFSFILLYKRSIRIEHPFVEFSLFRLKTFSYGTVIVLCAQFLLMNTVFWPIFFQQALSYTPLQAGSYTIISTLPVMVISPISGYLSDKKGPRVPVVIGFLSIIFACYLICMFCVWRFEQCLLWGVLLFGTGLAFIMTPTGTATLSYAPDNKRGLASGIYNTIRFTGASIGIATLGTAHEFVYSEDSAKIPIYGLIADNIVSICVAILGLVLTWLYLKAYNKKEILEG
ncbi:MAG: MFS transporter [Chlamydiae bacterium]|nr:MFS transporter [Chlamydiota bacterium]